MILGDVFTCVGFRRIYQFFILQYFVERQKTIFSKTVYHCFTIQSTLLWVVCYLATTNKLNDFFSHNVGASCKQSIDSGLMLICEQVCAQTTTRRNIFKSKEINTSETDHLLLLAHPMEIHHALRGDNMALSAEYFRPFKQFCDDVAYCERRSLSGNKKLQSNRLTKIMFEFNVCTILFFNLEIMLPRDFLNSKTKRLSL